jgi:site-specific DNA-methyltransferase (adenine-specific)/modification methylase
MGSIRDLVHIGLCRLYLADFRDVLPLLFGIAGVITDPPYGNDYRHKPSRSKWVRADTAHKPIIGNGEPFDPSPLLGFSRIILWGANYYAHRLPPSGKWLIWDKREDTGPDNGADCELAWTNLQGPTRMHRQLWRGICRRGEENVSRGGRRLHPNQKPVALMNWCLSQAGAKPGERWLDTHMGSASLGVACMRRGISYVGVEIDPVHFRTAVKRLQRENKAPRLKEAS